MAESEDDLIACRECDFLHRRVELAPGQVARCVRCDAALESRGSARGLDRALSLTLTGLILFVIANVYPFLSLRLEGRVETCTLVSAAIDLVDHDMEGLGALVLFVSVVAPALRLVFLLYVLLPLRVARTPWHVVQSYRLLEGLKPWSMVEVYLLGVLVALVKLWDLATIELGFAFWCFGAMVVAMTAAGAQLEPREVWSRIEAAA